MSRANVQISGGGRAGRERFVGYSRARVEPTIWWTLGRRWGGVLGYKWIGRVYASRAAAGGQGGGTRFYRGGTNVFMTDESVLGVFHLGRDLPPLRLKRSQLTAQSFTGGPVTAHVSADHPRGRER